MKKSIAIFGSTGSVGKQTVELIVKDLDKYSVEVITANNNWQLLAEQAKLLKAKRVVVVDNRHYLNLKQNLPTKKVLSGKNALIDCAKLPVDICVMAILGIAGLTPTMEAIKCAKTLVMANKESLVCAGHLINNILGKAKIIPIDSEHNAIFQIYNGLVDKITLTASGGPFYQNGNDNKTVEQAIMHPVWKMGKKISVDSATMMNKVMEVIEARYLFEIDIDKINIVIHPEAIIHGMISYVDGNNIAVLSDPDMKLPIAYALNWPERKESPTQLNLAEIGSLNFYQPNSSQFPALRFLQTDNYVALNTANEIAVNLFLRGKITFDEIVLIIDDIVSSCSDYKPDSIEEILEYDRRIRAVTKEKFLIKA
ncbi:MAG: 1-deoxy-D-xylulose-5-phosphate reductoisomerase [Rickettsiaceae bacterium H1]|nr:1-deoxy-D-xylulose-5-phosphate reductoisomerase [Rickettsiaceae bacterium H1]